MKTSQPEVSLSGMLEGGGGGSCPPRYWRIKWRRRITTCPQRFLSLAACLIVVKLNSLVRFFGRKVGLKKSFQIFLTFSLVNLNSLYIPLYFFLLVAPTILPASTSKWKEVADARSSILMVKPTNSVTATHTAVSQQQLLPKVRL